MKTTSELIQSETPSGGHQSYRDNFPQTLSHPIQRQSNCYQEVATERQICFHPGPTVTDVLLRCSYKELVPIFLPMDRDIFYKYSIVQQSHSTLLFHTRVNLNMIHKELTQKAKYFSSTVTKQLSNNMLYECFLTV